MLSTLEILSQILLACVHYNSTLKIVLLLEKFYLRWQENEEKQSWREHRHDEGLVIIEGCIVHRGWVDLGVVVQDLVRGHGCGLRSLDSRKTAPSK